MAWQIVSGFFIQMATKNNNIMWRIKQLEKQTEKLDIKIDAILENHLPHIAKQVESNKTRITVATAINVGAIITGILLSNLL